MKLYLVRHGESEGNVGAFTQGNDEPLTKKGQEQAAFVGERFKSITVDVILASPATRAKMTAEAIAKAIDKPIEFSEVFYEHQNPSSIWKKLRTDPKTLEVKKIIKDNFHKPGWKYEDGENFEELKARGIKIWDLINAHTVENVLLVTHGVTMRMLVALAIMGNEMTSHEYWKFFISLSHKNTGITILKSNRGEGFADSPAWKLVTWNDHAHLGEIGNVSNDRD